MEAEAAKAYLLKTDPNGVSLHGHLAEVLQKLLASKDPSALATFESLSLDVKAARFNPTVGVKNVPPSVTDDRWKKRSNALFTADADDEDTGVPNVVEEMSFFEHAGVGLAREETYRLFLAMTQLKKAQKLKSVRFFGKVLGTKKDYYVIEGTYATPPAAPAYEGTDTVPESPGTGLNTYGYYVASGVSEPFVQLPDVEPRQVVASMSIKKLFTGELDAPVASYPPFPGKEANYLRAQIARIAQATVLVPSGKYKLDEEVEEGPKPIILEEEYEPPKASEVSSMEPWVRWYGGILKIGRTTNLPKVEVEGEEEAAEEEQEEEVPPLGAIEDAAVSALLEEDNGGVELAAWATALYAKQGGNYTVAIAKSNRWPGAFSALTGPKAANVYFGYGHEKTAAVFTPEPPPPILAESADAEEQDDVTLEAENALLKSIEEAKMVKEGEEEEPEE